MRLKTCRFRRREEVMNTNSKTWLAIAGTALCCLGVECQDFAKHGFLLVDLMKDFSPLLAALGIVSHLTEQHPNE